MAEAPGPEHMCGGVNFSVANCAATSRINVSAKIPNEIVVDFDESNNHAELLDAVGNQRGVILVCKAHNTLKQPITVRITGENDNGMYHSLKSDIDKGHVHNYLVLVARTQDGMKKDILGSILYANGAKNLDRVDGEAKIVVKIGLTAGAAFTPGVTYQDTLTVDVTPAG